MVFVGLGYVMLVDKTESIRLEKYGRQRCSESRSKSKEVL